MEDKTTDELGNEEETSTLSQLSSRTPLLPYRRSTKILAGIAAILLGLLAASLIVDTSSTETETVSIQGKGTIKVTPTQIITTLPRKTVTVKKTVTETEPKKKRGPDVEH